MEDKEHHKQTKHNKMNGSAHGQVTKQIFPKVHERERGKGGGRFTGTKFDCTLNAIYLK